MLLCAVTSKALADEPTKIGDIFYDFSGTDATVTCKDAVNNYDAYKGAVDIPATVTKDGTTYNVTAIGKNAFINCSNLTSVSIPNSVTSIGNNAFAWCSGLTTVTIPGSVTKIGKYAFSKCTGLTSVNLSEGLTDIDTWAFNECTSLTGVTFPSTVKNVGEHAFHSCNNIAAVNFPSMEDLCEINFGWMGNPLYNAHHLQINGAEVTDVVIPLSVTKINDYTFHGGTNFTSITLHDNLTDIGDWAFAECYNLTNSSCVIPNNVTAIGDNAFYNTKFRFVTIGSKVAQIGYDVFSFDQNLAETVGVCKPSIAYWLTTTPPVGFANLDITANYVLNKELATGAMKSLKGLAYNEDIDKIFEVDGLKYIANATGDSCSIVGGAPLSGDSLIIPATITYNSTPMVVKDILSVAFNELNKVSYAELNNNNDVGEQAFLNCTDLRHIVISPSVKSLGVKAFSGCKEVRLLVSTTGTPAKCANANSISELDKTKCKLVVPVGTSADYKKANGWKTLTAVVEADVNKIFVEDGIQYLMSDAGDYCDAFGSVDNVEHIILESSVSHNNNTIPVHNIAAYAFFGHKETLDMKVSNNGAIEASAFEGCEGITLARLGSGINSIGSKAFNGCKVIAVITSDAIVPPTIEKDAMTSIDKAKKCKLVVPEESIEAYRAATVWKDYVATLNANYDNIDNDGILYYIRNAEDVKVFGIIITTAASVEIPDSVAFGEELEKYPVTSVLPYAFFGCNKLASAIINVSDAVEHNAFHNVAALKTLTLGKDVKSLGDEAFIGAKFDSIYSAALIPPTCGVDALKNADRAKCKLQVAAGAKESYAAADTWKEFVLLAQDAETSEEIKGDVDAITSAFAEGINIKEVFDTNGRRLSQPRRGINILRMSDGSTRKVLVK